MRHPIPRLALRRMNLRARLDPRVYQIASLSGLLVYGISTLHLDVHLEHVPLILGAALLAQLALTRVFRLPAFEPRSALISGLSLCLLLRTGRPELAALAAAAAVASKFLLRVNGKHVFNPTNFGLVAMMLITPRVWVSPGQWGNAAVFGFLLACLGGLVVYRAARSDVTIAFLVFYSALLFGRSLWLGEPMAIPAHRLQNGALLIFAFFMISDPRTTPDSRPGRILFALLVALGAGFVHFGLFRTNGLLWSLAACAPLVPLIDRLLPGARHVWQSGAAVSTPPRKEGAFHEPASVLARTA